MAFDKSIRRSLEIALFSEPVFWLDNKAPQLQNSILSDTLRAKITPQFLQILERKSKVQAKALGLYFLRLIQTGPIVTLYFSDSSGSEISLEVPLA
jgi:hypothetical protein